MQSLYVHIPHCLQKCHYCDFATVLNTEAPDFKDYFECLKKELRSHSQSKAPLRSLYFGGGTPSLVPLNILEDFINYTHNLGYLIDSKTEITLEINPGTLDHSELISYLKMGINRFSLGVQSFNNDYLEKIGRLHTSQSSIESLKIMGELNVNISVDLLYSLPNQSLEDIHKDLQEFKKFPISHISPYYLTLPKSHFLNEDRKEETDEMEDLIHDELTKGSFNRYEVSNYALAGFESQHNQVYWDHLNYLGIGVGAHSFNPEYAQFGIRFWNSKNIKKYMTVNHDSLGEFKDRPKASYEILKVHEALTDLCHTGLRQIQGFVIEDRFQKFNLETQNELKVRLNQLKKEAYIQHQNNHWSLSPKGLKWANKVFEALYFGPHYLNTTT